MAGVFLILFLQPSVYSQDWQSVYNDAVQAFKTEQYNLALQKAMEALPLSQKNGIKAEAYSYQILTATLLQLGDFKDAIQYCDREAELFAQAEGKSSQNFIEALEKQIIFCEKAGVTQQALQNYSMLSDIKKDLWSDQSYEYLANEAAWAKLLSTSSGEEMRAVEKLKAVLPKLQQYPEGGEDYLNGLYTLGNMEWQLGKTNDAIQTLSSFKEILEGNDLTHWAEYTQAKNILAQLSSEAQAIGMEGLANTPEQKAVHLLKTGLEQISMGKLPEAIQTFEAGIELVEAHNLINNTGFSLYFNFTEQLVRLEKAEEAITYWEKADKLAAQLYKEISEEKAYLVRQKGDIAGITHQMAEVEEAYNKSLDISFQLSVNTASTFFKSIMSRWLSLYEFQHGINLVRKYLQHPEITNTDPEAFSAILLMGYECFIQSGQFKEGIFLNTKLQQQYPDHSKDARVMLMLSRLYLGIGDYTAAEEMLNQTVNHHEPSIKAESHLQLARIKQILIDYEASERHYQRAIKAFAEAKNPEALADAQNSLSTFYMALGNYKAAEKNYLELLKTIDNTSRFYADVAQNLATVYQLTGNYSMAHRLLEKVIEIDIATIGRDDPKYAVSLQNLAAVYHKTGHLEKAARLYEEALSIDKKHYGTQHPSYANKLNNLAILYQDTNQDKKALPLLQEALAIRKSKLGIKHPAYAHSLYNLAVLYQKQGDNSAAMPLFEEMKNIYLAQVNEVFPALSENEKTAFYQKIEPPVKAYLDFAIHRSITDPEATASLLDFRLATKAILLNATSKIRHRILNSDNQDLIATFNHWIQMKERLAKLYASSEESLAQLELEALETQANVMEKQLSKSSSEFAGTFDQAGVSWRDIQSVLKEGEAALEMIRLRLNTKNDSVIYAGLLVKPTGNHPELILWKNGRALEEREFRRYVNCINFFVDNSGSFEAYWRQADIKLYGVRTLYISPDGVFNKINLNTLHDGQQDKYLIDKLSIHMVSSLKQLVRKGETPPSANLTASLFGYPNYRAYEKDQMVPADIGIARKRSIVVQGQLLPATGFDELPGTKVEIEKIAGLLNNHGWQCDVYLRDQADELQIKKTRNPAVLHIATHGFFKSDLESQSGQGELQTKTDTNPLLLSGLLLANSETNALIKMSGRDLSPSEEDGILTAYEAMNLSLDKTELVVLSACETGTGKVKNGEGVYGFQRSFLIAGAQAVLMSLWKVEDAVTQELMVEFYKQWLGGKDKVTAFRDTQLVLKKKYGTPYNWGAFVMIGN